jgi:hypothetical protein
MAARARVKGVSVMAEGCDWRVRRTGVVLCDAMEENARSWTATSVVLAGFELGWCG